MDLIDFFTNMYFPFQIGVKCLLKRYDSTDSYNICFIQEMSTDKSLCTVFVEGSAEKITVPLSALRELPYEQSSWGCPKKQRQIEHKLRQFSKERSLKSADVGKRNLVYHKLAKRLTIEDLTSLKYFKAEPQHIIALPVFDTKKKGFKAAPEPALEDKFDFLDSSEDFNRSQPTAADSGFTQELNSSDQSQNLEPPQVSYQAIPHLGVPPPPIEGAPYYSQFQIPPPTFHLQMETQLWSEPPPTTTIVNFGVLQSICLDGSDLPFNDISTLRFFFNYGIQEYNKTQSLARPSYNTDSEAQIPQPNSDQEVHKLTSSLENTHVYDSQSLESSNVNEHAQKNEFNGFAQHQNQINYRRDGHGRGRRPFRGRGNRQQYGDSRYFYRSSARNTGEAPRDDILGRQNTSVVESNSYGAQTPQTPPTTYFVQHSGDAAAIAPQTPASTVLYYYPQQPFVPYFNYMQPPPMIPQHFPQTPAVPVYDYAQPAFPAADTSGISSISGSEPARHPFVYSAFGQNMSLGVYTPQGQANFVPSSGWNSGQNS